MIFSEKTEVIYREMCGIIDFVCDNYVVIQISNSKSGNPARLIVFRENHKEIQILKASTK